MSEKKKNKGTTILVVVLVLALVGFVGYKVYGTLNQPTEEEAANDWEEVSFEGQKDKDGLNTAASNAIYTTLSKVGLSGMVPEAGNVYTSITSVNPSTGPNYFDVSKIAFNKSLGVVEVTITSTVDSNKYVVWRVCKSGKYDCSGDSREINGNINGVNCYYDEDGYIRKMVWNWSDYSYSLVISDAVNMGEKPDNPFNDSLVLSDLAWMIIQ